MRSLKCGGAYLPLSLSFDMSLDGGVALDDDDELDDGGVLGLMELLLELDEGVLAVPLADDDGLLVDGVDVLGDIVDELELEAGGVVVDGGVVDDVLLVSRWQPAAPIAAAMARTAQGFRFM